MEALFCAHPRVQEASITFATKQLRLTAEDPDALIAELQAIARTVEDGIVITARDGSREESQKAEKEAMPESTLLVYGGVLFAAGLILSHFGVSALSLLCCVIAYIILGRNVVATAARNLRGIFRVSRITSSPSSTAKKSVTLAKPMAASSFSTFSRIPQVTSFPIGIPPLLTKGRTPVRSPFTAIVLSCVYRSFSARVHFRHCHPII